MTVKSMTGFARIDGSHALCSWSWEIKSVNAKGLDVRCRLPSGMESLDVTVRDQISKTLKRGNVTANLTLDWQQSGGGFRVNQDILDLAITAIPQIEAKIPHAAPSRASDILGLRGVIEAVEQEITDAQRDEVSTQVLACFGQALESLDAMRRQEGERLSSVLAAQLDQIKALSAAAKTNAASQPEAIRERLQNQIREILNGSADIAEERMAQEVALLVTKADIREEIDRLVAHEQAARSYLGADGSVGRKLDFLCQEFNREANTLCSKATDVALTNIGLDLKTYIERFREQIQNIE
ncbi:MAG: YicC family protein [Rhodospirillales bacterium]|nr:YicC family protein [Rhodospirillales bacterium]